MATTILVVEDSATQAAALCSILNARGLSTKRVASAEEALEFLAVESAALVLSDVVMPGISGFDLCRLIKEHPKHSSLPVVLLTSLSNPLDIVSGLECGADNYVTKPYDPEYLCTRIRNVLDRRQLRSDSRTSVGVNVHFLGKTFSVTSEKEQILDLFISSVEEVVRANAALQESQRELADAQTQLEEYARGMAHKAHVTAEKYAALMHQASDAITVLDSDGRILEANVRATELFDRPLDELRGSLLEQFAVPASAARVRSQFEQLRSAPRVVADELDFVDRQGRVFTSNLSVSRTSSGQQDLVLAILHDLTERKQLEAQLNQSQKMEAVGQLAGGVAHDFNNLLTVINSYSAMLLEDLPPADSSRADVMEIQSAAERAGALTRQLLAFSRRQVLQPQRVDLNTLTAKLENMLRRLVREDVRIVIELAPDLGPIEADPGQLEQVLVNLVVNARDAMPDGGTVTIRTSNVICPPENLLGSPDDRVLAVPCARIVVEDQGTGIPDDVLSKMFEPFFTTKAVGYGTGLGLSTVYGIVKQSGGGIRVDSALGRGTTFEIYLPQLTSQQASASSVPEPAHAAQSGRNRTVLVVEDDDALRAVVSRILRTKEYEVIEARHGREALAICERPNMSLHLVLTDMIMPEMNGFELGQRIAKAHPKVRILFMSGHTGDAVIRRRLVESGAAFIEKPFTPEALVAKVADVLAVRPTTPYAGCGLVGV